MVFMESEMPRCRGVNVGCIVSTLQPRRRYSTGVGFGLPVGEALRSCCRLQGGANGALYEHVNECTCLWVLCSSDSDP